MKYTIYARLHGVDGCSSLGSLSWKIGDESGEKQAAVDGSITGFARSLHGCTLEEAAKTMVESLRDKLDSKDTFRIRIGYAPWETSQYFEAVLYFKDLFKEISEIGGRQPISEEDHKKKKEIEEMKTKLVEIKQSYFSDKCKIKEKKLCGIVAGLLDK